VIFIVIVVLKVQGKTGICCYLLLNWRIQCRYMYILYEI